MHQSVKDRLEDYLRRTGSSGFEDIEAHLSGCGECRQALAGMEDQARMLRGAFRTTEQMEPPGGFYARVLRQIESQRRPSLWSAFLEPQFGRRLVYSSLTLLLMMSAYMVSTEPGEELMLSRSPEQSLVEGRSGELGSDPERDRDTVLVHLTSFSE